MVADMKTTRQLRQESPVIFSAMSDVMDTVVSCRGRKSSVRYILGACPPNYPVPALADTANAMLLTLGAGNQLQERIAWDGIWQDDLPNYVPHIFL